MKYTSVFLFSKVVTHVGVAFADVVVSEVFIVLLITSAMFTKLDFDMTPALFFHLLNWSELSFAHISAGNNCHTMAF